MSNPSGCGDPSDICETAAGDRNQWGRSGIHDTKQVTGYPLHMVPRPFSDTDFGPISLAL